MNVSVSSIPSLATVTPVRSSSPLLSPFGSSQPGGTLTVVPATSSVGWLSSGDSA
jgi:hypothetical protein